MAYLHLNVILWVNGHTHRNQVLPHARSVGSAVGGGSWEVNTATHIDWLEHAPPCLRPAATPARHAHRHRKTGPNSPAHCHLRYAILSGVLRVRRS